MTPVTYNIVLILLTLWTIPWKIYAVWHAVKNDHRTWFAVLLILNTLAILEIYYIFKVLNKSWAEVSEDFRKVWRSGINR